MPNESYSINRIRHLPEIREIFQETGAKGLTWGRSRSRNNLMRGSHLALISQNEMLIAACGHAKNDQPVLFSYCRGQASLVSGGLRAYLGSLNNSEIGKNGINLIRNNPLVARLYGRASGHGRPYNSKKDSPLYGSQIAILEPDAALVICQHYSTFRISWHEYASAPSHLGDRVIRILEENGFFFEIYSRKVQKAAV